MLNDLLLHPKTVAEAQLFIARPSHALLIIGLHGSGKTALVWALAAEILGMESLENYPYFLHVTRPKGKQDIPIDEVRSMLHKLRLKTPGTQTVRRVVFIEDAHWLSTQAQNALLKAIEEPAADTVFMLSVPSERSVLPTIASRTQKMRVQPVTLAQAKTHYSGQSESEIEVAWRLSQGNAGLLHALLTDKVEHPLKNAVEQAKKLLKMTAYEKLIELDKLSKDKEQFALVLVALGRVLSALHRAAIARQATSQKPLLSARRLVGRLQIALDANVSPRLIALELALNLGV